MENNEDKLFIIYNFSRTVIAGENFIKTQEKPRSALNLAFKACKDVKIQNSSFQKTSYFYVVLLSSKTNSRMD